MNDATPTLLRSAIRLERHRRSRPVLQLILSRLLILPVALFTIATLIFLLVEAMPEDPVAAIVGDAGRPERIEAVRADLGLDRPLAERYLNHPAGLATLDPIGRCAGDGEGEASDLSACLCTARTDGCAL